MTDHDIERDAIRSEACTAEELRRTPKLRAVTDPIDAFTPMVRRFFGTTDAEPTELAFFERGKRIHVAHAMTAASHARLLREGEKVRNFEAAYMLVNGPIEPAVFTRYPTDRVVYADNHRVSDAEILQRRAVYVDVDVDRVKGTSATDDELGEASDVTGAVEALLERELGGSSAIARGCSGNGFFLLIAIAPRPVPKKGEPNPDAERISKLLNLLNAKFYTKRIKLDCSVFNAARLMPAPGTWKRKGQDTDERPHRLVTFMCHPSPTRIPLEAI